MLILLDGAKGAGKTTAGKLLVERLDNATYLALDEERRALPSQEGSITDRNRQAFEQIKTKASQLLKGGKTLIVDCGLIEQRIADLEKIAAEAKAPLFKFFFKAPYEVLLNRVKERDLQRGKSGTDVGRFKQVHQLIHAKDLKEFQIIVDQILEITSRAR